MDVKPFRTARNYDMGAASKKSAIINNEPSLTLQSHAADANINNIVRKFGVTKTVPISKTIPKYADYDGVFDYRTAVEMVMAGEEAFAQVPATIRARFHNDPGAFIEFCQNPQNKDELQKLGLAKIIEPTPEPEPQRVIIVNQTEPKT